MNIENSLLNEVCKAVSEEMQMDFYVSSLFQDKDTYVFKGSPAVKVRRIEAIHKCDMMGNPTHWEDVEVEKIRWNGIEFTFADFGKLMKAIRE